MRLYNPHSSNPLATSRCTKQTSLATKSFVPITLSSPLAPNRAILNGTRSLAPKGTPGSSKRNEETNTSGYASDGRIEQSSTDSSLSNIIIAATKGSLQGTHVSKPLFRKGINRGSRAVGEAGASQRRQRVTRQRQGQRAHDSARRTAMVQR